MRKNHGRIRERKLLKVNNEVERVGETASSMGKKGVIYGPQTSI
jgi:hypothetical protein